MPKRDMLHLPAGTGWLGWQVPLQGGIAGARTYKVISNFEAENPSQNSRAVGKEEGARCGLCCICCSHLRKSVLMWEEGLQDGAARQAKKNLKSGILDGSLGLYRYLFLVLQYHLQAQSRAGHCRGQAALQPEGAGPGPQTPWAPF